MNIESKQQPEGTSPARSWRPTWMLILGAAVGIGMAAYSLAVPDGGAGGGLAEDAVASVNGHMIRGDDYLRMLNGLRSDLRNPVDDEDRRHIVDRLIDEELLVQRGIELGLARSDRRLRAQITSSVIASVVAEFRDLRPSDAELEKFFAKNRDFFARTGDLRVRQVFVRTHTVRDEAARRRAEQTAARLRAGEDFETVRDELGDPELSPLPGGALPPSKLRDYLGPTALRTVLGLPAGQISDPVRSGTGYHVLQVVEKQDTFVPPLAEIRSQVVAELRRRRGDDALRDYLSDLRDRAEIEVAEPLP